MAVSVSEVTGFNITGKSKHHVSRCADMFNREYLRKHSGTSVPRCPRKNNAKPFQGAQFSTIANPWIESNAKQLRRRFVILQRRVAQEGVPGERNPVEEMLFRPEDTVSSSLGLQNACPLMKDAISRYRIIALGVISRTKL